MAPRLRPNAEWTAPSGHPTALAQGLWAGAAAVVVLTVSGYAGDVGILLAIFATAVVPGSAVVLAPVDILASRRATHPWLSAAIAVVAIAAVAWLAVSFALPSGLPLPPSLEEEYEAALPAVTGLLMAAERLASRSRFAWRDRALGAAAGYTVVAGVFVVGAEWLSWALLLALLPLRLPRPARVPLAVLSGVAALGLGQFFDAVWTARAVELAAFVAYAALSLALGRLRPARPAPQPAPSPPPAGA